MFKKAQRKAVKIRIAVTGSSGSGKTYSALLLAKGLGGNVAVIDTENGSASLYCDLFNFDVMEIEAPFTTEKYIAAINAAVKAKYNILVIDSISHEWTALLEEKDGVDRVGGNSYTNWAKVTKKHELFKSTMLHSNIHVIATMRAKQDYIIEINEKGKQAPKKIGMAPIQREGMDYEFTTVFDIGMTHEATTSKDRTGIFIDKTFKVTEETGEKIRDWLLTMPEAEEPKIEDRVLCEQNEADRALVKAEMLKYVEEYGINIGSPEGVKILKEIRTNIFAVNPTLSKLSIIVEGSFGLHFQMNSIGQAS